MQRLKYEKFNNSNLEKRFFDYYIHRYEYESNCFDIGSDSTDSEGLNVS